MFKQCSYTFLLYKLIPLLGRKINLGVTILNNLKKTLNQDDCLVISIIKTVIFDEKIFKCLLNFDFEYSRYVSLV